MKNYIYKINGPHGDGLVVAQSTVSAKKLFFSALSRVEKLTGLHIPKGHIKVAAERIGVVLAGIEPIREVRSSKLVPHKPRAYHRRKRATVHRAATSSLTLVPA
jgi:hypothetical protein